MPRTVVRESASLTSACFAPTWVTQSVPCPVRIDSRSCRQIIANRSFQSSKRRRNAVSMESRLGFFRVTVMTGRSTALWTASISMTLKPPTAVPSIRIAASPARYRERRTIAAIRSVASCPSTSVSVVRTPSMYDGACTTTPTTGTVSSENRKGASSIPRKRDFAFMSHQREMAGDLVHDRVRTRTDPDAGDRPGRKLSQARVLHEGRRQMHRSSLRLERPQVREGAALHHAFLLTFPDPLREPLPAAGRRLEGRHHSGVGHLDRKLPSGQVEVRANRDHELVVHVRPRQ